MRGVQIRRFISVPMTVGSECRSANGRPMERGSVVLLLLVVPFGLLWMLIALHRRRIGFDSISIRGSLVLAFLVFEVLLLGITEITSVGHNFTAGRVALAWIVVIVALLFVARSDLRTMVSRARSHQGSPFGLRTRLKRLSTEDRVWLAVIVVIFGVLVAVGLIYPPSNGDSMVYHLARVEHWIQNRTVASFATHYLAQVEFSPLGEYNLAHVQLLSGTDRFDACVQLVSALICIVGVSELARLLGASRSLQIAASVVCATIPTGILLATTTENDYFAAAIAVALLVILLVYSFGAGWVWRTIALGLAAGMLYMAKGTLPAMLGPVAVALFALAFYRRLRVSGRPFTLPRLVSWLAVAGAAVVAIVGPFVVQTWQLSGNILGSASQNLIISPLSPNAFGANIIRSTALNFDIGNGVAGIETYISKIMLGITEPRVLGPWGQAERHPFLPLPRLQPLRAEGLLDLREAGGLRCQPLACVPVGGGVGDPGGLRDTGRETPACRPAGGGRTGLRLPPLLRSGQVESLRGAAGPATACRLVRGDRGGHDQMAAVADPRRPDRPGRRLSAPVAQQRRATSRAADPSSSVPTWPPISLSARRRLAMRPHPPTRPSPPCWPSRHAGMPHWGIGFSSNTRCGWVCNTSTIKACLTTSMSTT